MTHMFVVDSFQLIDLLWPETGVYTGLEWVPGTIVEILGPLTVAVETNAGVDVCIPRLIAIAFVFPL